LRDASLQKNSLEPGGSRADAIGLLPVIKHPSAAMSKRLPQQHDAPWL
jgi:hypothetical protein